MTNYQILLAAAELLAIAKLPPQYDTERTKLIDEICRRLAASHYQARAHECA